MKQDSESIQKMMILVLGQLKILIISILVIHDKKLLSYFDISILQYIIEINYYTFFTKK
jgi:hypothetical protein